MPPWLFTNPSLQLSQSLSNYVYLPLGKLPRLSGNQPSAVTIWYYSVFRLCVTESQKPGVPNSCEGHLAQFLFPARIPSPISLASGHLAPAGFQGTGKALFCQASHL